MAVPTIESVTPSDGPMQGHNIITLAGRDLGNNDIHNVTFNGLQSPSFSWISNTRVEAIAPASPSNITVNITLDSVSYGHAELNNQYLYNSGMLLCSVLIISSMLAPLLLSISPSTGPFVGGNVVYIEGEYLGVNDTIGLSLFGSQALSVIWVNASLLIVKAGPAIVAGTGPVVFNSTRYGSAVGLSYTYNPRTHAVLLSNFAYSACRTVITHVVPPTGSIRAFSIYVYGISLGNNETYTISLAGVPVLC